MATLVEPKIEFCPACLMRLSGDIFELEGPVKLHAVPSCMTRWAEMNEPARDRRKSEIAHLLSEAGWTSEPAASGDYWALNTDVGFLVPVKVLISRFGKMITIGRAKRPLAIRNEYQFLARAA